MDFENELLRHAEEILVGSLMRRRHLKLADAIKLMLCYENKESKNYFEMKYRIYRIMFEELLLQYKILEENK